MHKAELVYLDIPNAKINVSLSPAMGVIIGLRINNQKAQTGIDEP
jgi:hypothetical protein